MLGMALPPAGHQVPRFQSATEKLRLTRGLESPPSMEHRATGLISQSSTRRNRDAMS